MPKITFVHALWGDEQVASWPKILWDIQWGWSWRTKPERFDRMVFAYGKQNWRYLRMFGLSPVLVSDDPVVDFLGVGNREAQGRGLRGTYNYGISMWEHKRHAICEAFSRGAECILWLDWDTRYKNRDESLFDKLHGGPEFQGRLRHYKNLASAGGLRDVYHGGCYYMRSSRVMEEVKRIRPEAKYVTDEALVTSAINNLHFNGRQASPQEHFSAGFDNPQLHGTRVNCSDSKFEPMYFEGDMNKVQKFERPMRKPPDEHKYYKHKL